MFVLWSVLFVLFMVPMFCDYRPAKRRDRNCWGPCSVFVCCPLQVPQIVSPNSAGWPMDPSAPLCVPLNTLMAFCHESWCCVIWVCFYVSFQGTSCISFIGPLNFWPLYGWLWSPFPSRCLLSFFVFFVRLRSGRFLVVFGVTSG